MLFVTVLLSQKKVSTNFTSSVKIQRKENNCGKNEHPRLLSMFMLKLNYSGDPINSKES